MAFKHWRSSAGIMLIKIELLIIYELPFGDASAVFRFLSKPRSLGI
jgi:hypothetical protein